MDHSSNDIHKFGKINLGSTVYHIILQILGYNLWLGLQKQDKITIFPTPVN